MLTKVLTLSLLALLVIFGERGFDYIAKKNNAKARAEAAFMSSDYAEAAKWLVYMRNELGIENPAASLNLGHAYFLQQDSAAVEAYLGVRKEGANPPGDLASIALQQLAVLEMQRQVQPDKAKAQLENAVAQSREALRQDYTNERARFNYELLKRLLDAANEQEQQKQQNKDQQKQEKEKQKQKEQEQQKQEQEQQKKEKEQQKQQQQQEKQEEGKEGEKEKQKPSEAGEKDEEKKQKEREQQINQRLRKLNLSREKAEQLLEAMRNKEVQYLQQNRKRAKNPNNKNLPDW